MIQTSYFANHKNFPDKKLVSISRYSPQGFPLSGGVAKELAPSSELLASYKDGMITDEQYVDIYKEETLSRLDPKVIGEKYKDSVLLCYEKTGDFCHRHIVASWLISNGIVVEEVHNKSVGIAVVGSRTFSNYALFEKIILKLVSNYKYYHFISGGADGADAFAERFASEHDKEVVVYLPDWSKGKGAGFIRNKTIWDNSDIGIAFWDGSSKGTEHSFSIAKSQNKTLYVVDYSILKIITQNIAINNGFYCGCNKSKLKTLF